MSFFKSLPPARSSAIFGRSVEIINSKPHGVTNLFAKETPPRALSTDTEGEDVGMPELSLFATILAVVDILSPTDRFNLLLPTRHNSRGGMPENR